LDATGRTYVAVALERAAYGRRIVVSVPTLAPEGLERAHVERADWVVEEHAGRVVRSGPPQSPPSRHYFATVTRAGSAFLAALAARGLAARPTPSSAGGGDGPLRVVVELSAEATSNDVMFAAHVAGAPLVELTGV
jgi:hypothetical protein